MAKRERYKRRVDGGGRRWCVQWSDGTIDLACSQRSNIFATTSIVWAEKVHQLHWEHLNPYNPALTMFPHFLVPSKVSSCHFPISSGAICSWQVEVILNFFVGYYDAGVYIDDTKRCMTAPTCRLCSLTHTSCIGNLLHRSSCVQI